MPTYIETCNCHGARPLDVIGPKHNPRPELIGQLLRDRHVARFLIAPTGYGKSAVAFEYAHIIFAFDHVFWMRCDSPCFLRDLDAGVIAREILSLDPKAALVVFDDIPELDPGRSEQLNDVINELLERDCEIIATCVPSADAFSFHQYDGITLRANDLILSEDEMALEQARGTIAENWKSAIKVAERAPAMIWGEEGMMTVLKGFASESIPAEIALAVLGFLAWESGPLEDLQKVMAAERVMDAAVFLSENYPFAGIDLRTKTYGAVRVDLATLAKGFGGRIEDLASASVHPSREGLCSCVADGLLEKGRSQRACRFMDHFATKAISGTWLTRNGWRLIQTMAPLSVVELYDSIRKSGAPGAGLTCMKAWALHGLADPKEASKLGKRVMGSSLASAHQGACAAVLCLLCEEGAARESALAFLQDQASSFEERAPASPSRSEMADEYCPVDWLSIASSLASILFQGTPVDEVWKTIAPSGDIVLGDETKVVLAWCLLSLFAQRDVLSEALSAAMQPSDGPEPASDVLVSGDIGAPARFIVATLEAVAMGLRSMDWFVFWAGKELDRLSEMGLLADVGFLGLDKTLSAELYKAEPLLFAEREGYRKHSAGAIERKMEYRKTNPDAYRKDDPAIGRQTVDDTATPMLHVNLFGGMDVRIGAEPVEAKLLSRKKTKSALALLVINRGREVSRDRMAQMLWPHSGVDAYKRNFYGIWSQLKKALSINGKCPYLIRTQSGCRIDSRFLASDITAFEELCRALLFGPENPVAWERLYAQVNEDFADDFMPYETENPHIIYMRERYREQLSDGLIATSTRLNALNEPRGALWFAKEALRRNDKREDAYIALMEAQIASNQRGAALETYFTCRRFLSDELGIDPSMRVVELYRSIIEVEEAI